MTVLARIALVHAVFLCVLSPPSETMQQNVGIKQQKKSGTTQNTKLGASGQPHKKGAFNFDGSVRCTLRTPTCQANWGVVLACAVQVAHKMVSVHPALQAQGAGEGEAASA